MQVNPGLKGNPAAVAELLRTTAVPLTRFEVEFVEIPRANSFCSSSVPFEISSWFGSAVLRSQPLIRFASPIAS